MESEPPPGDRRAGSGSAKSRWIGRRAIRNIGVFGLTLLAIEFLDELVFGAREAAWPLIRNDLSLDYTQVGYLLGLPNVVSSFVEPFLGILGDVWRRRAIVIGGGLVFGSALLLAALSQSFWALLASFVLLYPASGAFVSLSQATLMDTAPSRHEQNMARWTFAGSLGVVAGTLVISATSNFPAGWRWAFFVFAGIAGVLVLVVSRFRFPKVQVEGDVQPGFRQGVVNAARALRRAEVLRWLTLLEFSNLMIDVLLGFLALYFVDVVHVDPGQAALAVLVWTVVGLAGDFAIIPLLEKVRGLSYLRVSAAIELVLLATFLLVPAVWAKFVLLGLLGFFNAGWYSILQGRLYTSMPGQSGSVMAVSNIFGLVAGLLPIALGQVAETAGLQVTMWLLLMGPIALLIGLPRGGTPGDSVEAVAGD